MHFSVAEEKDAEKHKINKERQRKLTADRKKPYDGSLAQTEGLRPIKSNGNKRNQTIIIDDEYEIDPRRIRKLSDVTAD